MTDDELAQIEARQKAAVPPGRIIFESAIIAQDVPKLIEAFKAERQKGLAMVDALNKIHDLAGQMGGGDTHPHLGAIQAWVHQVTGPCGEKL